MKQILKFGATWCNPCKKMSEAIEQSGVKATIAINEIDVDDAPDLTAQHKVRGVPTLVFLENDVEVKRHVGQMTVAQLREWVQ